MRQLFSKNNIVIICTLALFNFVFLCEEFCFDTMIGFHTTESGVVIAQNIILGASVLGFIAYPLLQKICKKVDKNIVSFILAMICAVCMFLVYGHQTYTITLVAGIVEYLLFGLAGAIACFYTTKAVTNRKQLAKVVGISYALGVFIQFLNNNLVKDHLNQTIVIEIAMALLVVFLHVLQKLAFEGMLQAADFEEMQIENPRTAVISLIVIVALLTCIFSTLDNAVTLVHASGSFNIGQWPRLILAVSGLVAGILYDFGGRKYMGHMMYAVALFATACVIVIETGGSFVVGLIMFYISAGFFVVFFMTSFMDLSSEMKEPSIWAGLGRAINNLFAVVTTGLSVFLLQSGTSMVVIIVALLLFAAVSVALIIYYLKGIGINRRAEIATGPAVAVTGTGDLEAFAENFRLTNREREVLETLLKSEGNVQSIAEELSISRAALYRHIASMNEKTGTQNRVALLKFFYSWKAE